MKMTHPFVFDLDVRTVLGVGHPAAFGMSVLDRLGLQVKSYGTRVEVWLGAGRTVLRDAWPWAPG